MLRPAVPFAAAPRRAAPLVAAAALAVLAVSAAVLAGDGSELVMAGIPAFVLAGLALVVRSAGRRRWARALALVVTGGVVGAMCLVSLGLVAGPLLDPTAPDHLGLSSEDAGRLMLAAVGLCLAALAGLLPLFGAPRRALARVAPLDPASFPGAVAAGVVVAATLIAVVPLLVLGRPPVLDLAGQLTGNGAPSNDVLLRDQAYGLLWLIPAGLVAAGWGFGRDCRAAFERLGLVRPNRRQVLGGLGVAVACAGASLLLDGALAWFWGAMGWPRTDSKQLETLFAFATSPTGALVAGVTAGLGEELVMRGLLQPRLGLVLTNLCFTAMHAPQYNWDALLSVFVIGLVFGLVRRRTNTTTGALVHGTFDFLLFLAAALGISAI